MPIASVVSGKGKKNKTNSTQNGQKRNSWGLWRKRRFEKKKTYTNHIKKIIMGFLKNIGYRNFKDLQKIKGILSRKFPEDNISSSTFKIILNENKLKTWLAITDDFLFFIIDNGRTGKILKIKKTEMKYSIEEFVDSPNFGRLIMPNIEIPIVFDKGLTGSTSNFERVIKNNWDND